MDDNWLITETTFDPQQLHRQETVFTIGNGYLGTRGAFEEGLPEARPATLVNGVYDAVPVAFTELANAPNWLPLAISINGERFGLERGQLLHYRRTLNLRTGVLSREVRWRSPRGHTVDLSWARFASLADPHLLALRCHVTPLDFDGEIELRAALDGHVDNRGYVHWDTIAQGGADNRIWLHSRTRASRIDLAEVATLIVQAGEATNISSTDCSGCPTLVARGRLRQGQTMVADKLVTLYTSREDAAPNQAAERHLDRLSAAGQGYAELQAAHQIEWEKYWAISDIFIEGDDQAQRAIRFSIFQLLAAAPRDDTRVSIPAKALSSFAYFGHVFWDTEIYMLPFFIYTQPRLAHNLLMYRYHTLPAARRKASAGGYPGAQYAWESADTGDEVTPVWVPHRKDGSPVRIWTGDQAIHITADVAYGAWHYWRTTGDDDWMVDYGAEIVLETARFWESRVKWNACWARYEISRVMGPDEYHHTENNNAYTNGMARWHLKTARETLGWLQNTRPTLADQLVARLDLTPARLARWEAISEQLHIFQDPSSGVIEQCENFFALKDIDLGTYEPRQQSMQVLLGIEGANTQQVLKQPDVLLLLYLLSDEYDQRAKKANWDYYAPRTDHTFGSSLGPAIHAILACELGMPDAAYTHFRRAAQADLMDVRGNADDGLHAASAGGLWQAIVFGFGGLKVTPVGWSATARLPSHWRRLSFHFYHRGKLETVDLTPEQDPQHRGKAGRPERGDETQDAQMGSKRQSGLADNRRLVQRRMSR
ncbi:MAG: glycoside hydrolase family 65 protein [Chloroflexi bacterium]|nr:glycoside hydrolase family 65 protein [Chloroflexota bacterium]